MRNGRKIIMNIKRGVGEASGRGTENMKISGDDGTWMEPVDYLVGGGRGCRTIWVSHSCLLSHSRGFPPRRERRPLSGISHR